MHAFISYVSEDKAQVSKIARHLQNHGIKIWLDKKDLQPGEFWKKAIRTAIKSGNCFIACFSENYTNRDKTYMNEELNVAIEELRLRSTKRTWFIPVLLSPKCYIPDFKIRAGEYLQDIQHVSLYGNFDAGLKKITNTIIQLSNEDVIKEPIPPIQSQGDKVVTSAAKKLSKMPERSDLSVKEKLLLAASGDCSEFKKNEIIQSIWDHKNDAMKMVASMIISQPDNQLKKNLIILLAEMCSPKTISSEYPQVFEKCKNITYSIEVEKLLRPYFTWKFSEEEYRKLKELYAEHNPCAHYLLGNNIKYSFERCVDELKVCGKCNRRFLMFTGREESYDSGDSWYKDEFRCAWCGHEVQTNDDT